MVNQKKVYFDTCIISGIVNQDMKKNEMDAILEIENSAKMGFLSIHSSTMARGEIEKIPEQWRHAHVAQYDVLLKVKGSTSSWIELETSINEKALEYQTFREILKDKNDAKHLYLAKQAGIDEVITVDERTILSKANELESRCQMKVYSPSQYSKKYCI